MQAPLGLKLTINVPLNVTVQEAGKKFLLDQYRYVRDGRMQPGETAPVGILAAVDKLLDDANDDEIIRTVVAETTADIIKATLPECYPPVELLELRLSPISYHDTPERMAPPDDAVPLVIQK